MATTGVDIMLRNDPTTWKPQQRKHLIEVVDKYRSHQISLGKFSRTLRVYFDPHDAYEYFQLVEATQPDCE